MIRSFADKPTAMLFAGLLPRGVHPELAQQARKRLALLDQATSLADLAARRGNRLEKLGGDRAGQWSIRVTDQWRICFSWQDGDALDAWFGDYH